MADILSQLKNRIESFKTESKMETVGTVLQVGDGIAKVAGLTHVKASEMLEFPGGVIGVAAAYAGWSVDYDALSILAAAIQHEGGGPKAV